MDCCPDQAATPLNPPVCDFSSWKESFDLLPIMWARVFGALWGVHPTEVQGPKSGVWRLASGEEASFTRRLA